MFRVFSLPILSTVPRSGTWFLRYAISFLCHLDRGGRIDDRLTGRTFGDPSGPSFDFQCFRGGPLFHVGGTLPDDHLFIGHTVCPGFAASDVDWWGSTPFHVPGYDYLHEGMNYRYTPIDLAAVPLHAGPRAGARTRPPVAAAAGRSSSSIAIRSTRRCRTSATAKTTRKRRTTRSNGRPLAAVALRDYLFESALPSYAKQFISFQALAERHPAQVRLVPYERLMAQPVEVLAGILDHLSGTPRERPALADAVWLARREHMKAIENELGRSLDGTRIDRGSHITQVTPGRADPRIDEQTRSEAMAFLDRRGLDIGLFEWPLTKEAATAAA